MLRVYHLIIGAVLVVLIPLGAKFVFPLFFTSKNAQSNSVATPTKSTPPQETLSKNPNSKAGDLWKKLLGSTPPVPNGWQIVPCQEDKPLLCVSAKGKLLGTVVIELYPVKNQQNFQKHLIEAGIPLGSKTDYQNPEYQTKITKALQAWVADLYITWAKERQGKYDNKIVFSTYPPQQTKIGQLPGIRYGSVGIMAEGGVKEQQIGYVTYDGATLYVITTGFDPASTTGKFEKLENLAIFQPYLSAIAENLNLPMTERSPQP